MNAEPQQIWLDWAHFLHRRGLGHFAALLLEAGGPLKLVAAQLVYVGQPLMRQTLPDSQLHALAALLEDDQQTGDFIELLREGTPR